MAVPRRTAAASRGILGGNALVNSFRDLPIDETIAEAVGRGFGQFANDQPAPVFSPEAGRTPAEAPRFIPDSPIRITPGVPTVAPPRTSSRTPTQPGSLLSLGGLPTIPELVQTARDLFLPSAPALDSVDRLLEADFARQLELQRQLQEQRGPQHPRGLVNLSQINRLKNKKFHLFLLVLLM